MQMQVVLRGIPVGTVEIPEREFSLLVPFTPLPGFDLIRDAVAAHLRVRTMPRNAEFYERHAARKAMEAWWQLSEDLDLVDERAVVIPTVYVRVFEDKDDHRLRADIELGRERAPVAAPLPDRTRAQGATNGGGGDGAGG